MAKTIDKAKNAARAGAKPAASDDTPEEVLDADESAPDGVEAEGEEEDLSLDVDPTARQDEAPSEPADAGRALATSSGGAVTRAGSGGIYVPDALMRNPITRWLAEAYIELRKVTWPEPREAWNMSLVVVAVSVVMAALLAAADFGLGHLLAYFVSLGLGK